MSDKKIRVGIIGTGSIAGAHLGQYLKFDDVEIVAGADIIPGKADDFFAPHEQIHARTYTNHLEMLEKEDLDVVSVCTYNREHCRCTIDALEHGCDVLLEKPMSVTLDEAVEMRRAEKRTGKFISVGFQPVFEAAFNLATPAKLLELANPNQPLLRRLLLEAPGTYHHAIVVANLAEAAAEKIGANPLLARTGAYFHDIGKLKRPLYFKENQMGDNPHDRTDPYVSAAIVTAHTRDGLALAQKYHLPPEIQTIIMEHHGDTPVMYFYHKALQMADGKPVDIADFRYDGQRPTTKESAIVMLADTIEAAVRSIPDPTPKAIEQFIERLVRGKLEDGQLSNSPLTLRDIDAICEAFCKVLNGVFHERIEYPTVNVPARPLVKAEKEAEKETKQMQAEKQAEAEKTPEVKAEAKAEKPAEAEKTPEVKAEAKAEKPDVPEKPAAPVEESEENT